MDQEIEMLTFEDIKSIMSQCDGCMEQDEDGNLVVTMQWLHDFATAVAHRLDS